MASEDEIKSDYNKFWIYGKSAWSLFWERQAVAIRAYAGESWRYDEQAKFRQQGRDSLEFNLLRPHINLFSGYARDNIKSTIIGPQEPKDQQAADDLTGVLQWVYEKGDARNRLLNGFDDALKSAISLVGFSMDYTHDMANGDLQFWKRSYNSFVLDPNFTDPSLADCSEMLMRDFVTRDQAKMLLPMVDPKVIDEVPSYVADDKFTLLRPRNILWQTRNLLSFDSYYRQTTKRVKFIIDEDTGEAREMRDSQIDVDSLEEFLREQYAVYGKRFKVVERYKPTIEKNILLSGVVVYSGPDPSGLDEYPFVPILCYFEPQLDDYAIKLTSMGWSLLDAQRTYNKRQMRNIDMMDRLITSGFAFKASKLVDTQDLLSSGFQLIGMTDDAEFGRDVVPLQQGNLPSGWLEFTSMMPEVMTKVAGANESLFGQDEGGNTQVSGRLAQVRSDNGLRANRALFDQFEQAQMWLGGKVMKAIQINFDERKFEKILGRKPDPSVFDLSMDRFNTVVKQDVQSQTQQDAYYFELLKLREILGPSPPLEEALLEALPMNNKSDLLKKMAAYAQSQQQQQQVQQQDTNRLRELQESQIEQNLSLAQERRARVLADIGLARERLSQVDSDRAKANLDRVKALSELQKLSDDRLIELITFARMMNSEAEQRDEATLLRDLEKEKQMATQRGEP